MILHARAHQEAIILELEGFLDFETTSHLKETCAMLMQKNNTPRMVINMEKLKFVGSTGIQQFIKVVKQFNTQKEKPKLCHLSSEFVKLFKAAETARNPFHIFEDEKMALASFTTPPELKKNSKKKPLNQ